MMTPSRLRALMVTLLLQVCLFAAAPVQSANDLVGNPSPYLAMHGQDPVHWHDWGPEVLAKARETNKPVFISSGYFACHWCHVMQRESYRNAEIAALLNRHFIAVKLDRELHPALDDYLIGFVERTTGRAGWPLNVFLTPEGYPLLGLTYATPADFETLLARVAEAWERQGPQLSDLARRAAAERVAEDRGSTGPSGDSVEPGDLASLLKTQALLIGDELTGGFGRQTRFPMAPNLDALLTLQSHTPDPSLASFLETTFDAMMRLGLRDHLGGGFFRYTVDPDWRTPHFEKMLYNQALLVPAYLRAAAVLSRPDYRSVAKETLDFMVAELRGRNGGFISSLSALDGKDIEGGYYLWHPTELNRLLTPDQRRLLALVWRLEGAPPHEAGLLPLLGLDLAGAAEKLGLSLQEAQETLDQARSRLAAARAKRVLPRDSKQLAGWNGLALSAFAAGIRAFEDTEYRRTAQGLRDVLVTELWDGKALHRAVSKNGWIGEATLEDYAFVALGLRDWGKLKGSQDDLALSQRLIRLSWELFYRKDGWQLATESPLPGIPREKAFADSPLPSPAAVLIRLTLQGNDTGLKELARTALADSAATVAANPFAFASQAVLLSGQGATPGHGPTGD